MEPRVCTFTAESAEWGLERDARFHLNSDNKTTTTVILAILKY